MPTEMVMKYANTPDFADAKCVIADCKRCRLANMKAMLFGDEYCLAPKAKIKDGKCNAFRVILAKGK